MRSSRSPPVVTCRQLPYDRPPDHRTTDDRPPDDTSHAASATRICAHQKTVHAINTPVAKTPTTRRRDGRPATATLRRLYTTSHRRQRPRRPRTHFASTDHGSSGRCRPSACARQLRSNQEGTCVDIKVLKGSSACAQPPLRRAPRSSSREILTLPRRRLSVPLLHHGPPPATPRPMTYHPRDNATAHGPRPTRQRPTASDAAPTTQRPAASATTPHRQRRSSHDAARTTLQGRQSQAHGAPIRQRRHPRTQRRSSGRGHHQRSPTPSHTTDAAAPARGTTAATPTATQHHTTSHGRPSKASGRHTATPLRTNAATRGAEQSTIAPQAQPSAWLHHDTTDDTPDTSRPDQV